MKAKKRKEITITFTEDNVRYRWRATVNTCGHNYLLFGNDALPHADKWETALGAWRDASFQIAMSLHQRALEETK